MIVTIRHNPACGTSRNTLAMIRASDEEPVVLDFPTNPPKRKILNSLIAADAIKARDRLSRTGTHLCRPSKVVIDLVVDPVMEFTKEHREAVRREGKSDA